MKHVGPPSRRASPSIGSISVCWMRKSPASQEEFQYAEKVNEEKASAERDACLAPPGEEWRMMLRQEGALDRSIDRKVRILRALRKQFPTGDRPGLPTDQGDDAEMEKKILGIHIPSGAPAHEEAQRGVPLGGHAGSPPLGPLPPRREGSCWAGSPLW